MVRITKAEPASEIVEELIRLYRDGDFQLAEELGKGLLQQYPEATVIYNVVASAIGDQGRVEEALEYYLVALQLEPDNIKLRYNLGTALHSLNRLQDARACYKAVLAKQPEHIGANSQLAKLEYQSGNYKQAAAICDVYGHHNEFIVVSGLAFQQCLQYEKAITYLRHALDFDPDNTTLLNSLGICLLEIAQPEEAMMVFQKALTLDENSAELYNNLGNCFRSLGKSNGAIECYEKALTINPSLSEAHRHLSAALKYSRQDPHLQQMFDLFHRGGLDKSSRASIGFALAKGLEDTEQYNEAYEVLKEANELRKSDFSFDISAEWERFDNLKSWLETVCSCAPHSATSGPRPIFIVGMPRSGTTLVEQILSAHPLVLARGELSYLPKTIQKTSSENGIEDNFSNLYEVDNEYLQVINDTYTEYLPQAREDILYSTDKLPENFRWIGLIRKSMPESVIIHCERDIPDIALSIYKSYFTSAGIPYAYDLINISEYYKFYHSVMGYWNKNSDNNIYTLKYESLVHNPQDHIRDLLLHIGLPMADECLSPQKHVRPVSTLSAFQVREEINNRSLGLWKKYPAEFQKKITDLFQVQP